MAIKVLMFGWELPPYNSGGLGTASLGLTQGLAPLGVSIDFVVPKIFGELPYSHMRILDASDHGSETDAAELLAGLDVDEELLTHTLGYGNKLAIDDQKRIWIEELSSGNRSVVPAHIQAAWYARKAKDIARRNPDFGLVHAHDWMTYEAAIAARQVASGQGKSVPFIAHVHATEYDRCGENGDPAIIAIEKRGLNAADRVVAVSNYTKEVVHRRYGVPRDKISVVYNGIPLQEKKRFDFHKLKEKHKIVLFMGRITYQKGPEYFVDLAKAVTDIDPSVRFVMVGSGDMERGCIEKAAAAGLTGKMLFSSFLRGSDVDQAYQLADLFVMPSISEPFGIVALEAIQNGTPALVSKQSGVAEVTKNIITVDFWDTAKMRDEVLSVLNHPEWHKRLKEAGAADLPGLTWDQSGLSLHAVYHDVLSLFRPTAHPFATAS